mgnify:CR=1 FL=1
MTYFQERWKRKQNELRLLWGTFEHQDRRNLKVREDFAGNEEFSHINFTVERRKTQQINILYTILSFFVNLFLISICVLSFYLTNSSKAFREGTLKYFAGVINAIIIGITNHIQKSVVTPLLKL